MEQKKLLENNKIEEIKKYIDLTILTIITDALLIVGGLVFLALSPAKIKFLFEGTEIFFALGLLLLISGYIGWKFRLAYGFNFPWYILLDLGKGLLPFLYLLSKRRQAEEDPGQIEKLVVNPLNKKQAYWFGKLFMLLGIFCILWAIILVKTSPAYVDLTQEKLQTTVLLNHPITSSSVYMFYFSFVYYALIFLVVFLVFKYPATQSLWGKLLFRCFFTAIGFVVIGIVFQGQRCVYADMRSGPTSLTGYIKQSGYLKAEESQSFNQCTGARIDRTYYLQFVNLEGQEIILPATYTLTKRVPLDVLAKVEYYPSVLKIKSITLVTQ